TRHRRSDRKLLRSGVQMVFQDPYTSLDPRLTVMEIVGEPLAATRTGKRPHRRNRVAELLGLVGLSADMMECYPHQFSGGQRQRIGVARALALRPEILVCDEPVSALDVSVQAQVINLLSDLRRRLGLALVFIAHDLSVVQHVADRVAVMYLGQVVEHGTTSTVYERPAHPYTQALLSASPVVDRSRRGRMSTRIVLAGDPPSPSAPPSGCRFHTRCRMSKGECVVHEPILRKPKDDEGTRTAACHFSEDALTRLDEVFPADRPPDSPPT
ncbi:MAG: oligopeptide/dipeptide ABC transporter ATP-binding protein, partial [Nocardioidaceae bacterium]